MDTLRPLRRRDLPADPRRLARFLLGKVLVRETDRGRLAGRIVETEAYLVGDAASHGFRGPTPRNRSMFLRRGHAYIYFIYGTWFAMNVSAGTPGTGSAVLLRALEPIEGLDLMRARRPEARDPALARGPGCLATALGIDRSMDGSDLCAGGPLWLGHDRGSKAARNIGVSVRIGITKEAHRLLRYFERGHPSVSGPKWMQDPVLGRSPQRGAPR